MNNKICIGFFKDFSGEDSILISADIYGLVELEGIFSKLAEGLADFNFSDLKLLDKKFRINLIAYNDTQNFGLRQKANGQYEWRVTQEKWNEFREKLTAMYQPDRGGHQYMDSDPEDNGDLQVILSCGEYPMSFWEPQVKQATKPGKELTDFQLRENINIQHNNSVHHNAWAVGLKSLVNLFKMKNRKQK